MATKKGKSVVDWENAADSSTPTVFYRTLNVEGLEIFTDFLRRIDRAKDIRNVRKRHHLRSLRKGASNLSDRKCPSSLTFQMRSVAPVRRAANCQGTKLE
jgi:hypothetical protein